MFFKIAFALILTSLFFVPSKSFASELFFEIEETQQETDIFLNQTGEFKVSGKNHHSRVQRIVATPEMYWPVDDNKITSDFGYRPAPCGQCSTNHQGIDFANKIGTPVYASLDGVVSRIEYAGEYGLHIYIKHIARINNETQNWTTVYAHLNPNSVADNVFVGSLVKGGTQIAEIGNTGLSTGPHLHFELRIENKKVDPEKYLRLYAY